MLFAFSYQNFGASDLAHLIYGKYKSYNLIAKVVLIVKAPAKLGVIFQCK